MADEVEEVAGSETVTPPAVVKPTSTVQGSEDAKLMRPVTPKVEVAKVETPPAASGDPKPAAKVATVVKDDEEIPEDAELITLPRKNLAKRLGQHTAAELKKRFGTADFDEISAKLKKADEYEAAQEAARVEQLSETEKLKEERDRAVATANEWKTKFEAQEEDRVVTQQDSVLAKIAVKHVKEKFVRYALPDFAAHLKKTYTEKEIDQLGEDKIVEWFAEYAKDNPEFAIAKEAPKVEKKPLTTSPGSTDRPAAGKPAGEGANGKTMKPGLPNSMTPQEARAAAGAKGYRY